MNLAKLISEQLNADDARQALEHNGAWFDWPTLRRIAAAIGNELDKAGIGYGARVGLVARNRPQLVAAMLALMSSRRRTVMIYAFQSAKALAEDLQAQNLPAVIADLEDLPAEVLNSLSASDTLVIGLDTAQQLPEVLHQRQSATPIGGEDTDIAVEMLTSGTTGKPKRLPVRWSTLNAAAEDLLGGSPEKAQASTEPADILPFPIGNISGLYYLIPAVGTGRRLVLLERFNLENWLDALQRHGCQYAAVPPAAVNMLLDSRLQRGDLGQLAALGVGAAPLAPEVQEAFEDRFGIPILIGYGATEFCGVIASWVPEDHAQYASSKRGSVGRARPGISLRIVDPSTDQECPVDTVGVIEARVPRIGPDFVRTTDLGRLDAEGFLYLHGRADQMINRGGFKVDPTKITQLLCQHPAVADAGVTGIADERLGQVPVAAVELRPGQPVINGDELLDYLREHLRSFELPSQLKVVEALPRTPSMKVRLADLPALFD